MANQKEQLTVAMKKLLLQLKQITIMSMEQSGVPANTDLSKSVKYVVTPDGIQMEVLSYYPYVSAGRKARIKRVPIKDLIVFIKKNNIVPRKGQTINQLAYAIQLSIYKHGIRAKSFEEKVETGVADYTAVALADVLAEQVADELVQMFAPVTE